MEQESLVWLLKEIKNPLVRISPKARGSSSPHYMRGRLLAYTPGDKFATVQPMGHRRPEKIEIEHLKKWNAKTPILEPAPLTTSLGEILQEKIKEQKQMKKKIYTKSEKDEMLKLFVMGKTNREVAEITGIKVSTVGYHGVRWRQKEAKRAAKQRAVIGKVTQVMPTQAPQISSQNNSQDIVTVVKTILALKVSDTTKLLSIEALLA